MTENVHINLEPRSECGSSHSHNHQCFWAEEPELSSSHAAPCPEDPGDTKQSFREIVVRFLGQVMLMVGLQYLEILDHDLVVDLMVPKERPDAL